MGERWQFRAGLARAKAASGDREEARNLFEDLLTDLSAERAHVYIEITDLLQQNGFTGLAARLLNDMLAQYPGHAVARERLVSLQQ